MKRERARDEEEQRKKSMEQLGDGLGWCRGHMIGKGSCGSVFLAYSYKPTSYLPSLFAVKSAEYSDSASIQRENQVLLNISKSPNIIRCFGEEVTNGGDGHMVFNLLLEYGSGGTLAELIKKSGGKGLPESEVRRYTESVLRGLSCVHECGYAHCDIKPENIILVPESVGGVAQLRAKIGDFGYAKRANQRKRKKMDPYLRGTPMYLSPEAVLKCDQEPPSDIWALGCIVLEMLTGKPPWVAELSSGATSILGKIGKGHQVPTIPSEISKEGKNFLKCCFARKARCRWTAQRLLGHPFVEGLIVDDDGDVEREDEFLNSDLFNLSLPLLETDDSGDSSKDESEVNTLSRFTRNGAGISKQVLSNIMLRNRVNFTISAGV